MLKQNDIIIENVEIDEKVFCQSFQFIEAKLIELNNEYYIFAFTNFNNESVLLRIERTKISQKKAEQLSDLLKFVIEQQT